ncbi:MAG: hypothetical protein HC872_01505 [Gammaproteobacteria bacterium]|nr:hypothetical protein [Gammaproteobacteria bacterium]
MRIAKPLLLVLTPIGVAGGLFEAWRLAGGLVVLMAMMLMVIGFAMATVIHTIRRERREQLEAREEAAALSRMAEAPPESEEK